MYDRNHLKQVVHYANKYCHVGISSDTKGWLLWDDVSRKVITAALVRFKEVPILAPFYSLEVDPKTKAVISAIECHTLGTFKLGNTLDQQDAAVAMLERCHPYGLDLPSYAKAIKLPDAMLWRAAMEEEMDLLWELEVHIEDNPPADQKQLLKSRWLLSTKRGMSREISRRKARIIVGGHCQLEGVNYQDTFVPTLRLHC
jgi:hypothetical protein